MRLKAGTVLALLVVVALLVEVEVEVRVVGSEACSHTRSPRSARSPSPRLRVRGILGIGGRIRGCLLLRARRQANLNYPLRARVRRIT